MVKLYTLDIIMIYHQNESNSFSEHFLTTLAQNKLYNIDLLSEKLLYIFSFFRGYWDLFFLVEGGGLIFRNL